ncbi:MAG: hypothetical protein ACK558_12865, partial [Pseudomonadota bacterium]
EALLAGRLPLAGELGIAKGELGHIWDVATGCGSIRPQFEGLVQRFPREIKGHEKEIRQKWPELGDEF